MNLSIIRVSISGNLDGNNYTIANIVKRNGSTLEFQINVRVQINIRAGKFAKNNKRTGPKRNTDWKI